MITFKPSGLPIYLDKCCPFRIKIYIPNSLDGMDLCIHLRKSGRNLKKGEKMKIKSTFIAAALLLLLSACTLNRPISATSNPLGNKVGIYTRKSILFFPPYGNTDAAIQKAAENGGITRISTVDYNVTFFLLFTEYRTIVRGE